MWDGVATAGLHACDLVLHEALLFAAIMFFVGGVDDLSASAAWLYGQWLPGSVHELRDFPLFAQRVSFFPDVPEHEAVTDIFLPIQS